VQKEKEKRWKKNKENKTPEDVLKLFRVDRNVWENIIRKFNSEFSNLP
jgi:hypothetical protein